MVIIGEDGDEVVKMDMINFVTLQRIVNSFES